MKKNESADLYTVAITDELEAARLRKLLDGYGQPRPGDDPDIYEVCLTPVQAERIEDRHGRHLRMMVQP